MVIHKQGIREIEQDERERRWSGGKEIEARSSFAEIT
jgi:hypothetical protein